MNARRGMSDQNNREVLFENQFDEVLTKWDSLSAVAEIKHPSTRRRMGRARRNEGWFILIVLPIHNAVYSICFVCVFV
jgi:hypothetical protein